MADLVPQFDLIPQAELSRLERVGDLLQFRNQLLNKDETARFQCLYYFDFPREGFCTSNCLFYEENHRVLFKTARINLAKDVDQVKEMDFISVLRTLFCGDHDLTQNSAKFRVYKNHFKALWKDASVEEKSAVWDTLRKSGRYIEQPRTPRRSPRPNPAHMKSAPAKVPNIKVEGSQQSPPSPPNPDCDTPSRPRTAQATLGKSVEAFADISPMTPSTPVLGPDCATPESHAGSATPSPSLPPARPIFESYFPKTHAVQSSESSAQATTHESSPFYASKPNESDRLLHLHQKFVPHIEGNRSPERTHRGVEEPKVTSLWNQLAQKIPQPEFKTIFEKLENAAKAEHCSEESVTTTPTKKPEPQGQPLEFVFRGKTEDSPEYGGEKSKLETPPAPSGNPFKFNTNSPEPKNVAFAADSPFAWNFSPPTREPSPREHHRLTPSPLQSPEPPSPSPKKQGPKPCAYDIHQPAAIATMMYKILKKPVEEREGTMYVLEAPEFFADYLPARSRKEQWVKIGISTDVPKRIESLKARCGITDLKDCYKSKHGPIHMDLLRKIEQVCHAELNNFRRRMDCKNSGVSGAKCNVVHTEWFAVDKAVAVRTVERWRRFLDHKPYEKYGTLNDFWKDRLYGGNFRMVGQDEEEMDHESAHKRYNAWLDESIREHREAQGSTKYF